MDICAVISCRNMSLEVLDFSSIICYIFSAILLLTFVLSLHTVFGSKGTLPGETSKRQGKNVPLDRRKPFTVKGTNAVVYGSKRTLLAERPKRQGKNVPSLDRRKPLTVTGTNAVVYGSKGMLPTERPKRQGRNVPQILTRPTPETRLLGTSQPLICRRKSLTVTEDVMYDFLSNYLMSEDDLVENGYPRPSPTSPGKAVFKTNKEQPSKDPSRRICRRCGKPFVVLEDGVYLTKEECVYHAGKLFRRRGEQSYSCCQGDAGTPGCCVGKVHVSDETCNTDGFMTTIVSPLLADQPKKIFAMDCEMCYTTGGLELTRITVVNWNLEGVYDTFVMPERTIVDYNTRFSGVTEELLRGVTTTIREVQAVLLSMIHKDTILVGHSLESDLKATKLMHSKVVDTSVVFPHRLGRPYKRALRNLMADYLKKIIQDSVAGHDSHEDARSCLELMRFKVKEDMKKKNKTQVTAPFTWLGLLQPPTTNHKISRF